MEYRRKIAFIITVVIISVVLLHRFGWLVPIENASRHFINRGSGALYGLQDTLATETEAEEYREDLLNIRLELLERENMELRSQLNFFETVSYQHVGADVIGRSIDPIGTTIILNRGFFSGAQVGDPVIVGSGVLIGKVARVESDTSIVRLINDNSSRIAATATNEDRSLGLIEGGFGLSVRMNFIPQNEIISQGDVIVTSGLESFIPRGLLIGVVEVVEKTPQGPFQQAVLTTTVDLARLSLLILVYLPQH